MTVARRLPRLSLSAQVIIGLVLGIGAGLFFGERVTAVSPLGSIFIGLLQMTVIPYIVVSLIAAIGRLERVVAWTSSTSTGCSARPSATTAGAGR
jgi:Na+/H+-dicarboxylate symporter